MSDRYKQVKLYNNFKFCPNYPVDILKGAIYIDRATNKTVFQLKFINMQNKKIKAMYVQIKGSNDLGEQLEDKEYQYLDLNVNKGQEFGTEQLKEIENNTIRNIDVTINKVIFVNNEVWENKNFIVYDRGSLEKINNNLLFIANRKITEKGLKLNDFYYPDEKENFWTCLCGAYNSKENKLCYKCGCSKDFAITEFTITILENNLKDYKEQLQKTKEELNKKIKNIFCKTVLALIILLVILFIGKNVYKNISTFTKYKYANRYIENEQYIKAIDILEEIVDYKDSKVIIESLLQEQRNKQIDDSSISIYRSNNDEDFRIVAVKNDGTVVATGNNKNGECNVSEWNNIVSVSTSVKHTVGLKSNGTVVATGNNTNNQCNVEEWKDIIKVIATIDGTVGLKENGTIVTTGKFNDVPDWENIIDIEASGSLIYGLTSSGKVLKNGEQNEKLNDYKNIINIDLDNLGLLAIKVDESIEKIYVESMEKMSGTEYLEWKNIIYTNNEIGILAINSKGNLVYTSKVTNIEEIKNWDNLIYVALYENRRANEFYYIGITKNGDILTNRKHNNVNFEEFTNLKIVTDNKDKILE